MSRIVLLTNVVASLCLLGAYFAPDIDPRKVWQFSFLGLMYPILFLINICFMVYWLFVEMRFSLISILCLLFGFKTLSLYFGFNGTKISAKNHDISLVSFNISNASEAYDRELEIKHTKQEKMNSFLSRFYDEDIICLQEVGSYAADVIKKNFPNYNFHKFEKGAVILSKHKMIKKGQIEFGTKTNSCLWADLVIGYDTVRVYNLHLQSNQISSDAKKINSENIDENKTWTRVKGILRKYRYHHKARTQQALQVKEHADLSPHRVIICGDFNDVPLSYNYNILQKGLIDGFKSKGNGMGSTFNGVIPFLRIDYILADPKITIQKFNIIKENYSDHYPVAALIILDKV